MVRSLRTKPRRVGAGSVRPSTTSRRAWRPNCALVARISISMARRSGGDDLDDLYIFETDDPVDQPEAAGHQPAAAPAAAKKKTGKRKRPAREAEEKASAVTHLEELCDGASTLLPLLEAPPKRSALRRMEPASVVVVCSSALRCTEVIRAVKAQCRCSVGKLFAKHMKLGEQLAELERETPVVCVGHGASRGPAAQLLARRGAPGVVGAPAARGWHA